MSDDATRSRPPDSVTLGVGGHALRRLRRGGRARPQEGRGRRRRAGELRLREGPDRLRPGAASRSRDLEHAITDAGYEPRAAGRRRALGRGRRPRAARRAAREIARAAPALRRLDGLALPLLYLGDGRPRRPAAAGAGPAGTMALAQLLLTTPILAVNHAFYTRGILAVVKTGAATMDTLVALGTGAAWLYSLAASVLVWTGRDPHARAPPLLRDRRACSSPSSCSASGSRRSPRGKTSEAIRALMGLAPRTAVVVRDGARDRGPGRAGRGRRPRARAPRPEGARRRRPSSRGTRASTSRCSPARASRSRRPPATA